MKNPRLPGKSGDTFEPSTKRRTSLHTREGHESIVIFRKEDGGATAIQPMIARKRRDEGGFETGPAYAVRRRPVAMSRTDPYNSVR